MAFYADSGVIEITDTSLNTVFSTDWKMPTITHVFSGSLSIPARGRTTSNANVNYFIGSVDATSNFSVSTGKIVGGSTYPWRDTYFNSSGSVLTNLGWADLGNRNWRIRAARSLSVKIVNGSVYISEEYYNLFQTLSLRSFTFTYKIYIGRFE
jgi:hypothetical protein